jgi:hypothetical protein
MKNLEKLLRWLHKHGIEVSETRLQHDGSRVLIFVTQLPDFPHGGRHAWYTLTIAKGQTEVSPLEVSALLRHCWHGELEIPKDPED